jgi:hypothetical protein
VPALHATDCTVQPDGSHRACVRHSERTVLPYVQLSPITVQEPPFVGMSVGQRPHTLPSGLTSTPFACAVQRLV